MKKHLTDAEKIAILTEAAQKADRLLLEIDAVAEINSIARGAGNRKCSDWTQSVARRARKTLQAALKRVCGPQAAPRAGEAAEQALHVGSPHATRADEAADAKRRSGKLESVRIDIEAMKANGILKEAKRK